MQKHYIAGAIALVLAAYILGTASIYRALMSQRVAAVWDFYQLWYGARVLLAQRDPYDPQITLEMQQALYGRSALASEGQPAFYYPLPVLLLVMPLAFLPYPLAASAWLCLLLFAVVGAVAATLWGIKWHASAAGVTGLAIWALALFPVLWSVLLGQVSVLLLLLLNIGLAAMLRRRDGLAGACLACSLFKPQLVYLLLPLVCMWVLINRRWRLAATLIATTMVLGIIAWLLLPMWPVRFVASLTTYAAISPFDAPLQVLTNSNELWIVIGGALVAACLVLWLQAREQPDPLTWAMSATLVVSALVVPRIGMINQLILLWPAIAAAHQLWNQSNGGRVVAVLLLLAMAVIPWAIAATLTIPPGAYRYTAEHQAMSPLLPTVLLLAMLASRLMPKRNASRDMTS